MVIARRLAALALVLSLALPGLPGASAKGVDISFASPATLGEASTIEGAHMIALVFKAGQEATVTIDIPRGATYTNATQTEIVRYFELVGQGSYPASMPPERRTLEETQVTLTYGGSPGFLLIEDGKVHLTADGTPAHLVPTTNGECLADQTRQEEQNLVGLMGTTPCLGAGVLALYEPTSGDGQHMEIHVTDASSIRWRGALSSCETDGFCPDGGGQRDTTYGDAPDNYVRVYSRSFIHVAGDAMAVTGEGVFNDLYAHGPSLGIEATDWLRLPATHTAFNCNDCESPDGRTVTVHGAVELTGLRPGTEPGTLTGNAYSPTGAAFFDEEPALFSALADPGIATATAVAAVAGVAILAKLLAPLFTRISGEAALTHPRRQEIMAYIQENPGTTFRELSRGTDIPPASLRHHLDMMARSELIMEQSHRATLRYFENHGKYDHDWQLHVVLRDPDMAHLHAWLHKHPGAMQAYILDAMQESADWSRSTTQNRLQKLVEEGLVTFRSVGRRKHYQAHDRPQGPPPSHHGAPGAWRNGAA